MNDGFDTKGIEPIGGVWGVFIAPDGRVLGPGNDDCPEARCGYAIRENGQWREISNVAAWELRCAADPSWPQHEEYLRRSWRDGAKQATERE